jgi:hypothetical protein
MQQLVKWTKEIKKMSELVGQEKERRKKNEKISLMPL